MDRTENIAAILALARRKLNEGKPSFALQAVVAALRAHGGEEAVSAALRQARTQYHGSVDNTPETDQLAALFAQCALVQPEFTQAFDTSMDHSESSQSSGTALPQEAHNDASLNQEMEDVERIPDAQSNYASDGAGGLCPQHLMDPVRSGILAKLEGAPSSRPSWESGKIPLGNSQRGAGDEGQPDQESRVPILAESGRLQVVVDASADGSSFTCPHCNGVVNFQRQKEHHELWCTGMH